MAACVPDYFRVADKPLGTPVETTLGDERDTAKCKRVRLEKGPYCDAVREIDLGEDLIDLAHQPGGINAIKMASFVRTCRLLRVRLVRAPIDGSAPQAGYDYEDLYRF